MGSAYHWEARRRQMALDGRQRLLAQQQQQQQKLQEDQKEGYHPEKRPPTPPEPKEQLQPPSAQRPAAQLPPVQPPPGQPQPAQQPAPPGGQDTLPQCSYRPGLDAAGQTPCEDCRSQAWPPILPRPGLQNPCQPGPAKTTRYPRLTSTDYLQQW
ncbi:coiled-coil domain-containing protein 200 [Cavia porcellus]|uniref:coiled-coil domain-containing protein 200 n=1 Tax=Cavia porcellus TaxID=10141 RepID=UPI002FE1317A